MLSLMKLINSLNQTKKALNATLILSKNELPILMIHGKADSFVPCEMSIEGFEACSGDKKLILVENAGHGLSYLKGQPEYQDSILDILDKLN